MLSAIMVGHSKGASVRSKNYDLGAENLHEAKREDAQYQAKMQEYFQKAAQYEKALQKEYSDFLNKSAIKVSNTHHSGKHAVNQSDSIKQQLPKITNINTGTNSTNKPITSTSSYIGTVKNKQGELQNAHIQYKMTYNSKDPNIFPNVYGYLSENKEYLQTIGIAEGLFKSKSFFDMLEKERVIEAKRSVTIGVIDKLMAEFWNNYHTYTASEKTDFDALSRAEKAGVLIDAIRKRGLIISEIK